MLPKTKPWSWLIFFFPLYFTAMAMTTHSRVETGASLIAQAKATWLGVVS